MGDVLDNIISEAISKKPSDQDLIELFHRAYNLGHERGCIDEAEEVSKRIGNFTLDIAKDLSIKAAPDTPIRMLGLPARLYNTLTGHYVGIKTIDQLASYSEETLLKIDDIGPGFVKDIKRNLARYGYRLRE